MIPNPKSVAEITVYIRQRLGHCLVGVEITDSQIEQCIFDALEEMSRWLPERKISVLQIPAAKVIPPNPITGAPAESIVEESVAIKVPEYFDDMTGFRDIMDCVPDSSDAVPNPSRGALAFGFPIPLEYYGFSSSPIVAWHWENFMTWIEEAKRTYAVNFEWEFHEGYLYLWYVPLNSKRVCYAWTKQRSLETVPVKYRKWMLDFAFYSAQMIVGEVRSKITSGIPAPGGTMNLNGDNLKSEAREEINRLREDLMYSAGSEPFSWND